MGLSRNKVAVSEGAAGSPPFYGESDLAKRKALDEVIFGNRAGRKSRRGKTRGHVLRARKEDLVVQLSMIKAGRARA